MHAKSEKFNQEGWVDAWTEMDANGFCYTIVSERGTDYVRNGWLNDWRRRLPRVCPIAPAFEVHPECPHAGLALVELYRRSSGLKWRKTG